VSAQARASAQAFRQAQVPEFRREPVFRQGQALAFPQAHCRFLGISTRNCAQAFRNRSFEIGSLGGQHNVHLGVRAHLDVVRGWGSPSPPLSVVTIATFGMW
jgi:hypothetical protein